jgi:hypothetical protein
MAFDLDAFIRESEGDPFTFTFGGVEFTWPARIDLRAEMALAEGRLWDALKLQFGQVQYEKFMEVGDGFDVVAVRALFDAHAKHHGSSLGESSASASSSGTTAKRSRPTSKRTIK